MNNDRAKDILYKIYNEATSNYNNYEIFKKLKNPQLDALSLIVTRVEYQKAVTTALITSLVKKIESPEQNIKLHKHKFKGGYSARTLDTKIVTPFLKEKFGPFAMRESGWLTRSIEQNHPFDRNFPGQIKDAKVKKAFLDIIEDIEDRKTDPTLLLKVIFILLIKKFNQYQKLIASTKDKVGNIRKGNEVITIDKIIYCMSLHFFGQYKGSGAALLPVIALYSIYEILITNLKRYSGKVLKLLKDHTTSDLSSNELGDIEITFENGKIFECVEVKHDKQIDSGMIYDIYQKIIDGISILFVRLI